MSSPKYDGMVFKTVPHGIEVIFFNIVDGQEIIYEDFFPHHNTEQIKLEYIKIV